jgi:hypothetical protein
LWTYQPRGESYLDAIANSDDEAIRGHLQWLCTFLTDGRSETLDRFPYSPNALKSEKNWATSTHREIEVVAVSATKAQHSQPDTPGELTLHAVRRTSPTDPRLAIRVIIHASGTLLSDNIIRGFDHRHGLMIPINSTHCQ